MHVSPYLFILSARARARGKKPQKEIAMNLRQLIVRPLVAGALLVAPVLAADNYKIDSEHATVIFSVSHFNLGDAYGRFNDPTGTVVIDKDDPSKSSFTFEVKTENIDTDNEKRDAHLKGPDFFNAKQFPVITFKSTGVKSAGENKYEVTGDLNLHGVTKSITFPIEKTGEGDTKIMGYRTGWKAQVGLKRSEYGMTYGVQQGAIGDDVNLTISFEAVKS
jgi:polyisoprenoid-binding protein YceI